MPTLRGGTVAPTSASRFFRNRPFFALSPLGLCSLLPSYHRTFPHGCVLHPSAPPIQKSAVARPHSLDLFISPTCPVEHTTISFIACLSVLFFPHIKGESGRASHREVERGLRKQNKKNPRKQLHAPPLYELCASGFPAPESVN